MEVDCPLEGLRVRRQLRLDRRNAVFAIEETVHNIAPLGRLYNMVQHPTLAAPFLDESVVIRSEEHTSELQSLMRISYAVFCLKKKNNISIIKLVNQNIISTQKFNTLM